ncbi:hypothetical protein B0I37DRAFT_411878 [Chaetomium sp. MPI-CAGE-AT-0009]|nr:hypothetical protein B0I37DRAFT_411878 [Chaetomium sp. MPI-CAGE-AT-0009]
MQHPSKSLVACIAVAGSALAQGLGSVSIESVSGCAAVVSTTDICNTCVTMACVVPATITAGCNGCGETPPTIYRSFPCDGGCENIGCQTIYTIATETDNCELTIMMARLPGRPDRPDRPDKPDKPDKPAKLDRRRWSHANSESKPGYLDWR